MSVTSVDIAVSSSLAHRHDADAELTAIRHAAAQEGLPFAGSISPLLAAQLVDNGVATLVDVRSAQERASQGAIPDALHVAWLQGPGMVRNPRFARELEQQLAKSDVVLFICASGKRSRDAAVAATKAGFAAAYSVADGIDGHAESGGGWRASGLPWQRV